MRCALALLAVTILGCPAENKPSPGSTAPEVPPLPRVDAAFVLKAFGPGYALAGEPLIEDLDPRPGIEAVLAVSKTGKHFELAVVRGNHQIVARAPLAGKVLGQADITYVGKLQSRDLLPTSQIVQSPKAYLLPIETLVYHRSVCGILAFRYRRDALALVGELSCKCWRKEAGGEGGDPMGFMKVIKEGNAVRVEMKEEEGETGVHRWDPNLAAFLSPSAGRTGAKQR